MNRQYNVFRFTAKIEGRTETGEWELIQELSGNGLVVKTIEAIRAWVDLARDISPGKIKKTK